jgi:hypothetical protein
MKNYGGLEVYLHHSWSRRYIQLERVTNYLRMNQYGSRYGDRLQAGRLQFNSRQGKDFFPL